ncbi:hypothetical protein GCM10010401_00920 [Rarobacter faecitabidus]|uniref:ATP-grasp domain-containing protein n=1 Tax=Rarobacter faecitabidus TaxID=13243 RepID=A0A542ZWU7_RARFA|nr:hypothetical protein [Rarobacter faecitabidus]TQL64769.1 hypothetical protein FB461_1287 [Rarobacter faecitabidus]
MPQKKIALVTCSDLPDLDGDDQPLIGALAAKGVEASAVVWDDEAVEWDSFHLVVVRSTWDYAHRRDEFIAWAARVPRLVNAREVLEWNTDKQYLKDLGDRGITTIDTLWLDPAKHLTSQAIHTRLPAFGDYVIKPTISAGAQDTIRYRESSAEARGNAILHVRDLLRDGRHVMVQRYLKRVDTVGETCLIFIQGDFSHAVRKEAMLQRDVVPAKGLYQREVMTAAEASAEEFALAEETMDQTAAILGIPRESLLYARVDMLPGDDDKPHLLELELTEPSLFFAQAPGSLDKFVDAILARLG